MTLSSPARPIHRARKTRSRRRLRRAGAPRRGPAPYRRAAPSWREPVEPPAGFGRDPADHRRTVDANCLSEKSLTTHVPILRNEPEKPCPAAEPEPSPEPQPAPIAAAALAATVPAGPPTQPPVPAVTASSPTSAEQRPSGPRRQQHAQAGPSRGPTQSEQLTTDHGPRTTRRYPPHPPANWELIPETCRGDFSRYKDYQRMLQATYGVSSPEEFRKKYRKDPPLG